MIEVTRTGDVFVLTMVANENRFNPTMLDAFERALDEVDASDGAAAVVLTGQGKFFSNGLDLDWMMANAEQGGPALVADGLQALYRRLVMFPTATVAAVNGHAFAGGFVGLIAAHPELAVTHDLLVKAMVYGTALASFNVEAFGTERVTTLTSREISARVGELQHMTTFEHTPITLRG